MPSPDRPQANNKPRSPPQRDGDNDVALDPLQSGTKRRAWATFPQARSRSRATTAKNDVGGVDGGSLSAWLEPREPSRGKKRAKQADRDRGMEVVEEESPSSDEEQRDDGGMWMSERLSGLDPGGAAR